MCLPTPPSWFSDNNKFKNKKEPDYQKIERQGKRSNIRMSNTKEIQNKHSSRPVGGAETGTGVETTHVAMAGLRLAECGTNRAGSPSTSRPYNPTFAQINPEGRTQEWWRTGQAEWQVAPGGPTFAHR